MASYRVLNCSMSSFDLSNKVGTSTSVINLGIIGASSLKIPLGNLMLQLCLFMFELKSDLSSLESNILVNCCFDYYFVPY